MQVGKIATYKTDYARQPKLAPSFERKLKPEEIDDYKDNAILAALDYLGTQSVAMILQGSCNPVTEYDMGIGSPCNKKAEEVINFEMTHGFNANQLGPMGEVTRGDISPYSATVFALNKMFIDAEALTTDRYANILPPEDLTEFRVNYENNGKGYTYSKFFDSFENYDRIIKDSYHNFIDKVRNGDPAALELDKEYHDFKLKKKNKVIMAALFQVLSNTYGTRDVAVWESEIDRNLPELLEKRDKKAIDRYKQILRRSEDDINSYMFGQFLINKQMKENKQFRDTVGFEYINDNLVGNDRSEEWMYPEVFLKDFRLGCPEGGEGNAPQVWDIPVIDPKKLFNSDGTLGPAGVFLKEKLEAALEYCENLRIDHALGLVDPYIYKKSSVNIVDGYLNRERFYGNNISQIHGLDPYGDYQKVLEKIVLPVLAEHGITPDKAVWEDLGTTTWIFDDIYRNKLRLPGMTQLHWVRGEGSPKENWALMGSHDEDTAINLVKKTDLSHSWDYNNGPWHIDYLAGYLNQDNARIEEREQFKRQLLANPLERVKAKFAELFVSSNRIQIPFTDFFGIDERYNEKGKKTAYNWKLRLSKDYQDEYYKNLSSDNPTALNMPEILRMAVQARIDQQVVQFRREHATMNDNSVDENKVAEYRYNLHKQLKPVLDKLAYYEQVLKEKE